MGERAVQVFKRGVKKLSGIIDDNIAHFLLYYRSTPQNTTGESPSFLMLNRQIRTRVDIMLPQRHNDVIVKQQNMLLGGKRKEPRTLYMGDPVRIVNFSKSAKNQDKWLAGVVTDKRGPLTYLITLDDGRIFRRHIDYIRLSTNSMTNIGTPQPLDVEVPNVLISDTTTVDGREPLFCDDARSDSPKSPLGSFVKTLAKYSFKILALTLLLFWFCNQQDFFTNMIADGSAWGLMCQFRLK